MAIIKLSDGRCYDTNTAKVVPCDDVSLTSSTGSGRLTIPIGKPGGGTPGHHPNDILTNALPKAEEVLQEIELLTLALRHRIELAAQIQQASAEAGVHDTVDRAQALFDNVRTSIANVTRKR